MSGSSLPKRLTSTHAAARIGVSKATLHRMRDRGEGPECIQIGTRFLYEPAKISEWLEGQRRVPGQSAAKISPQQQTAA